MLSGAYNFYAPFNLELFMTFIDVFIISSSTICSSSCIRLQPFDLKSFIFIIIFLRVEIEHIHGQVEENPYLAATAVPRTPQPETKPPPQAVASDSDSSS